MCLSTKLPMQEILSRIPSDDFYVYKMVDRSGDRLVSPHYHYVWSPGIWQADLTPQGNGDAGFYCMLFNPGEVLTSVAGKALLRLKAKKEDIITGGPDTIGNVTGTCLVIKRIELSLEDYENTKNPEVQNRMVTEARIEARELLDSIDKSTKEKSRKTKKESKEKAASAIKTGTKSSKTKETKEDAFGTKEAAKKAVSKSKNGKKDLLGKESVSALKTMAKELKIEGISKMKKDVLIQKIIKAQKAKK